MDVRDLLNREGKGFNSLSPRPESKRIRKRGWGRTTKGGEGFGVWITGDELMSLPIFEEKKGHKHPSGKKAIRGERS